MHVYTYDKSCIYCNDVTYSVIINPYNLWELIIHVRKLINENSSLENWAKILWSGKLHVAAH